MFTLVGRRGTRLSQLIIGNRSRAHRCCIFGSPPPQKMCLRVRRPQYPCILAWAGSCVGRILAWAGYYAGQFSAIKKGTHKKRDTRTSWPNILFFVSTSARDFGPTRPHSDPVLERPKRAFFAALLQDVLVGVWRKVDTHITAKSSSQR